MLVILFADTPSAITTCGLHRKVGVLDLIGNYFVDFIGKLEYEMKKKPDYALDVGSDVHTSTTIRIPKIDFDDGRERERNGRTGQRQ